MKAQGTIQGYYDLSARKKPCLTPAGRALAADLGAQNAPAQLVTRPFLPDGLPLGIGIKEG